MVRRSFAFAFADKSAGMVLSILMMVVISRLMTPAEVGLFMVASSLVVMIEAFRDFGVAAFLIQETDLTRDLVRSGVTIITLLSLLLGAIIFGASNLLAGIYGDPALGELIRLASVAFLIAPISNPLLALMRRDMDFGAVARINVAAAVVNTATTIALAAVGVGPISFVWGSVLAAAVTAIGAVLCRPDWWIFVPSLKHWRQVVPFGLWSSVITLLGMLYDAMPRLLLGRILGFGAVGLFSRSVSLTQLPDRVFLSAVQPVVLPAMATKVRENKSLAAPYLLGISLISAIQWPALVCLALLADPIVRLLLGAQWMEVVPLVRIVSVAALVLCPSYFAFPALVSLGKVRQMAAVSAVTVPLATAVLVVAAQFGLTAVAWSMILANTFQVGIMLAVVRRPVGFAWNELARVAGQSLVVTLCAAVSPALTILLNGPALAPLPTVLAVLGAAAGWGLGLAVARHPLAAELSRMAGALGRLRPGTARPPEQA